MAVGDLYQLTFKSHFAAKNMVNVFTYRQQNANTDPTTSTPAALALAFAQDTLPLIEDVQITNVIYDTIEVINAFDPTEIYVTSSLPVANGSVTVTDIMAIFLAWEFRTQRQRRDIKRGYKRFSGLDESVVANNAPTAGMLTTLNALGTGMSTPIQYSVFPLTPTFEPVIVKRIPYVTPEGNDAYRLPNSAVEMGSNYYAAVFTYTRISTQNTRKTF